MLSLFLQLYYEELKLSDSEKMERLLEVLIVVLDSVSSVFELLVCSQTVAMVHCAALLLKLVLVWCRMPI